MKSAVFIMAAIAILASHPVAEAKPSTPVVGCHRTVVVPEGVFNGCYDFAEYYHVTFEQLLAWNTDLRKDCLNLDVGNNICVEGPLKKADTKSVVEPKLTQLKPHPPASSKIVNEAKKAAGSAGSNQPSHPPTPAGPVPPPSPQAGSPPPPPQAKPDAVPTRPLYPNLANSVAQSTKHEQLPNVISSTGPKAEMNNRAPSGPSVQAIKPLIPNVLGL
ncbi:hypothetical protein BGZ94_008203 [Podila epigama]|nr:hypothetical protein BGZ94_008203 [Podila epigama]